VTVPPSGVLKVSGSAVQPYQRWPESLFQKPNPLLSQNFWIGFWQFFKFGIPTPIDSVTRVNDSSQNFWWLELDSTQVEKNGYSTRLESPFLQNDSTRVTVIDSRLKSETFLQNFWVLEGQTQFVCTQRNEDFLLQWWSRLGEIFCFDCLVALCYIL